MEHLGVNTSYGIEEPIQTNDLPYCIECGVEITKNNDSGWEMFKEDGRTTQHICKKCDRRVILIKDK